MVTPTTLIVETGTDEVTVELQPESALSARVGPPSFRFSVIDTDNNRRMIADLIGKRLRLHNPGGGASSISGTVTDVNLDTMTITMSDAEWR